MARSNAAATTEAPPPAGHNNPPSPVEIIFQSMEEAKLTPIDLLLHSLAAKHGEEIAKADPLAIRANGAVEAIASDDDLKVWAEIGRDASKLFKSLDEARKDEKRPVEAAINGLFKGAADRASRIYDAAVARATAWNKKQAAIARAVQEAEAQRLRDEAEARRIAAEFEIDNEASAVVAAGEAAALAIRAETVAAPRSTADLTRTTTDSGVTATTAKSWKFEIVDPAKIDLNAIRMFIDPKAVETAIGKIVRTQKGATKIEGVRVFEDETAQFRG